MEVSVAFSAFENGCVSREEGPGTDWLAVVCRPAAELVLAESLIDGEGWTVLGEGLFAFNSTVSDDVACTVDLAVVVGDGTDCVVVTAR